MDRMLGVGADGKRTMIRKPANDFHCLADDPNKKGFNVACYHKDLEPFMAYGRKLAADGVTHKNIFQTGKGNSRLQLFFIKLRNVT